MVCCAIGVLMLATLAIWWKRLRAALSWRLSAPSILAVLAVVGVAGATSALTVDHLGHFVSLPDEQALLADFNAQPTCGTSSNQRTAAIATYRLARATNTKE